ncbi:AAA family ATPase, partial [Mycobacterium nebraskense]|uniref:AAA family ATPase n=1 Tax=Mycobacterium nebraskense TaxID=244292 RepID=UPI00142D7000
ADLRVPSPDVETPRWPDSVDLPPEHEPPPDPRSPTAGDEFSGLQFHELSTRKPPPDLAPALANVHALRNDFAAARKEYEQLRDQIVRGNGPATLAERDRIRDMRARADADRPYLDAVLTATEQWTHAEREYDRAAADLAWAHSRYQTLAADPTADPLDIDSATLDIAFFAARLPTTTPAEQHYPAITAARAARAAAAGGPDKVLSHADVDAYLHTLRRRDDAALTVKQAALDQLRHDLDAAETATARAYAEAETRTAQHISDHIDIIENELAVLAACTSHNTARPLHIPTSELAGLTEATTTSLPALARLPFTVTPVRALPGPDTDRAMAALHRAAHAAERKILWASPTQHQADTATDLNLADTATTHQQAHTHISDGTWTLPPGSLLIIDDAAAADPHQLADLITAAHHTQAGVILLDTTTDTWPPKPSTQLLQLLHTDLPWAATLDAPTVAATHTPTPP